MNARAKQIYEDLMNRIQKPCSCCAKPIKLQDIKLEGMGEIPAGNFMLYFTHKTCRSTMVAGKVPEKKVA